MDFCGFEFEEGRLYKAKKSFASRARFKKGEKYFFLRGDYIAWDDLFVGYFKPEKIKKKTWTGVKKFELFRPFEYTGNEMAGKRGKGISDLFEPMKTKKNYVDLVPPLDFAKDMKPAKLFFKRIEK